MKKQKKKVKKANEKTIKWANKHARRETHHYTIVNVSWAFSKKEHIRTKNRVAEKGKKQKRNIFEI